MVLLTKIYTRSGDEGKTSLGDSSRVDKYDIRIEAIGAVDELNAVLGVAKLHIDTPEHQAIIATIQNDLFDAGADLCWPTDPVNSPVLRIKEQQTNRLESEIDVMNKQLQILRSFVLPGGSAASAYLHLARTIARRAERCVYELHAKSPLNINLIKYLNRLSDHLFVMARYLNDKGNNDVLWKPGQNQA